MVWPATLTNAGTFNLASTGSFSATNRSRPTFARPMALSMPPAVSTMRAGALPFRSRTVTLLVVNAPSWFKSMIDKHVALIAKAADAGAQVVCMQELFYGPYFCCEQDAKWYAMTERIPDGPTTKLMCELAKKHQMVLVVPMYEEDLSGVYYN